MHRCLSPPTTSPHCLALTLSRFHTVSLYLELVLTLSHVRFRTSHGTSCSCHMVSSSVSVSHRLALFCIHLTTSDCVSRDSKIRRTDNEPRTVRRTIRRTGNTHCGCCSNCCCAHTLLCQHTNHRCTNTAPCTIQHTTRHINFCCPKHY